MCRANKIFFHSDLAQMVGKMAVDVNDLNIDLASISSHKVRRVTSYNIEHIITNGQHAMYCTETEVNNLLFLFHSDLWTKGHRCTVHQKTSKSQT